MRALICIAVGFFSFAPFGLIRAQLVPYEMLDSIVIYTSLEQAMNNPDMVYRLDLSKQKLKVFPAEIFQLKNLNDLKLDKNKIDSIPPQISSLQFLQRFSMMHNDLLEFPVQICHMKNLRKLNLADNELVALPDDIEMLQTLEALILWQNPIDYYPTSLGMLENLKTLDLLHNLMTAEEQDELRNILPNTYITFSPPCNCKDEE